MGQRIGYDMIVGVCYRYVVQEVGLSGISETTFGPRQCTRLSFLFLVRFPLALALLTQPSFSLFRRMSCVLLLLAPHDCPPLGFPNLRRSSPLLPCPFREQR